MSVWDLAANSLQADYSAKNIGYFNIANINNMDEWALLTRFKDLKEKEAALKEKQDLKSKQ